MYPAIEFVVATISFPVGLMKSSRVLENDFVIVFVNPVKDFIVVATDLVGLLSDLS